MIKRKIFTIRFFGIASEQFECYNIKEAEEYLEENWKALIRNLDWDIETEIEEGE